MLKGCCFLMLLPVIILATVIFLIGGLTALVKFIIFSFILLILAVLAIILSFRKR